MTTAVTRDPRRDSDRYITPQVVCVALVVGGVLVLAVVGSMVFLTLRGLDPDPMLKFTAQVGGGLAAVMNLWVSLAGRKTTAKTERLAGATLRRVEALEDRGRHAAPEEDMETAPTGHED